MLLEASARGSSTPLRMTRLSELFAEKQLFDPAEQMIDANGRSEEGVARNGAGEEKIAFGDKVTQPKQRSIAQLTIALQLLGERFAVLRSCRLIDDDEIRMKPARNLQGKSGIVFFVNGKAIGILKGAARDR
jgi:hypothetical protein